MFLESGQHHQLDQAKRHEEQANSAGHIPRNYTPAHFGCRALAGNPSW
jgi:hypothetical protein